MTTQRFERRTRSGDDGSSRATSRTRTRDEDEDATAPAERTREHPGDVTTCPECSGHVAHDEERGETVCEDCGLVVTEDEVDRGPEWRAFDAAESDEKSRVGAPTTKMMHDDGLSTTIGWQNKDAYGNSLSSQKRQQMQRLRTWDERFRTRDSQERNLKQALGEIDRMASALGLPKNVRETASVVYRRALEDGLLPGRSIEGVATASLHAAARQAGSPRTVDEVERVSRVDEQEFTRTYRYLVKELSLEVQPADPASYLPRFASDLDASDAVERRARELVETAKREAVHSGKSPVGIAAAAIYAAGLLEDAELTQREVGEAADVSEVTIRDRYRELLRTAQNAGGQQAAD
ncbi:transcription initiation factor IIB [Halorubellus sp. JP-L1]|uniref:transcription initiation factor IIB n=1 Tax=Halorubellus sp. JP-L1 TaxID=2715753 RepID=UPI001407857F|nr:transcription initiation factor IIB [Halorubellus sp. JP-L1]NHN41965.1 transcription initiation factor IIB [Halorubellus sp. JP-L1]